jgi:hypothetical protein
MTSQLVVREPSATPVVDSESGTVPFGIAFDSIGRPLIAEAGTDAVQRLSPTPNGDLTLLVATSLYHALEDG